MLQMLALISLPVLIFTLIEVKTDGEVTSVPLAIPEPEIQLPLTITLIAVDVVLTVMLLIGIHKVSIFNAKENIPIPTDVRN